LEARIRLLTLRRRRAHPERERVPLLTRRFREPGRDLVLGGADLVLAGRLSDDRVPVVSVPERTV
jgi:hypothetical protein